MVSLPESTRDRPVEIEITPQMVEAGLLVLLEAPGSGSEHLVEEIYRAMVLASHRACSDNSRLAGSATLLERRQPCG